MSASDLQPSEEALLPSNVADTECLKRCFLPLRTLRTGSAKKPSDAVCFSCLTLMATAPSALLSFLWVFRSSVVVRGWRKPG